ncbi:MAG: MFS transporter [Rhodobacteraceae bacterium]|nr:MFS transporter [Paracoccaceae bacterium]
MGFLRFLRDNARWLAAGVLLSFGSSFGQTFFISIFAGQIRADFDLSHGEWGGIYTLGTTASAVVMVWAGALTDRFRVRVLGAGVFVLLALACIAMSLVQAVWLLPAVIFLLRFAGQGMASHLSVVAMARWFVATRGRALSVATMGFALGEAFLPVSFVAMMEVLSWRVLWLFAAGISLIAAPILVLLLRRERTPQMVADESPVAGMENRHWRRGEVLRHWLFWMMVPALLAPPAFGTAFFFQQVHLAEVKGWDHVALVALFPVYTSTGVAAMFAFGWAIDRFGTARLMPVVQLPMALGFLVFSQTEGLFAAAIGLCLMGATVGANSTVPSAFWAEFYGTRHLGGIKAIAAAVMVLGSAIGPGVTGALIDLGLSFPEQLLGISGFVLFGAGLVGLAMRRVRGTLSHPA